MPSHKNEDILIFKKSAAFNSSSFLKIKNEGKSMFSNPTPPVLKLKALLVRSLASSSLSSPKR